MIDPKITESRPCKRVGFFHHTRVNDKLVEGLPNSTRSMTGVSPYLIEERTTVP